MKYLISILILLVCSSTVFSQVVDDQILSDKFKDTDSIYIKLNYKDLDGCLGYSVGRIDTQIKNGKFGFRHITDSGILKSDYFVGEDKNVIDYFIDFETVSKREKSECSGISGDHCFAIELSVNGIKTDFLYKLDKTDNLNRITLLINKLEKLKIN